MAIVRYGSFSHALYLSQSFSVLSLHSESSYDPDVELSSIEKVISDQDLLTLILLRLPATKLICFTTVSKLWQSHITAPRFSMLRSNHSLPLCTTGLFFQVNVCKIRVPNFITFVSLNNDNHTTSPFSQLPFAYARDPDNHTIRILHSCAGLLLCSSCTYIVPTTDSRYYIYNPTTSLLRPLPNNDRCDWHYAALLAFDPSKSPHYRVIMCGRPIIPGPAHKQFFIYSSENRTWRPSGQPFLKSLVDIDFSNNVYCNGCVHWISKSISVSEATDTEVSNSCYYFSVDEERLKTMPRPPIGLRSSQPVNFYMGESHNHLYVVEVYACDNILNVHEMNSDYSGWFLKYEVDLSPISRVFPEMLRTPEEVYMLSILNREYSEEDPFFVLHIPGKPRKGIRYNLVDRSFKKIWEFDYRALIEATATGRTSHMRQPWLPCQPPRKFQVFQFIDSLSGV